MNSSEGDVHWKAAEKCMSTNMFKWSSDHLSASSHYEKAGLSFALAGNLSKASSSFKNSAKSYARTGSLFKAGTMMEKCAEMEWNLFLQNKNKDGNSLSFMEKALEEAAEYFVDMGELPKASDVYKKMAIRMEKIHPLFSLPYFIKACDFIQASEKPHLAIDVFRTTLGILIKNGKIEKALLLVDRLIPLCITLKQDGQIHKYLLTKTILQLSRYVFNIILK